MVQESSNLGVGSICTRCLTSQPELRAQTTNEGKLNTGRERSPAASYICHSCKEISYGTVGVAVNLLSFGHIVPQFNSHIPHFFVAVLLK